MSWRRLLAAGLTAAALAGLAGGAFEWWRFGPTDAAAAARVEAHVRGEFREVMTVLEGVARQIATDPSTAKGLATPSEEARLLFDLVAAARAGAGSDRAVEVTLYDARGDARAWVGRPSDIPAGADRLNGPAAFFLAPSSVGLRLVHLQPVAAPDGRRLGTVAAEYVVSPAGPAATIRPTVYRLSTPQAPVSLRTRWEGAGEDAADGAFILRSPSGEPLAEASVATADLRSGRERLRRQIVAAVVVACGVTLFLLIGPLLDRRSAARNRTTIARASVAAAALLIAGAVLLRVGLWWSGRLSTAVDATVWGWAAVALVALCAGPVAQLRLLYRGSRRSARNNRIRFAIAQLVAGALTALLIVAFDRLLGGALDPASVDLRHFSLHPWSGTRLLLLGGVIALHIAILWTATLTLIAAAAPWSLSGTESGARAGLFLLWVLPALAIGALAAVQGWGFSVFGLVASAAACALAALVSRRVTVWYRHATVAARIFAVFVAFLVPTLLLYPSVNFFAQRATERLIATRFALEVQQHPETIQKRMTEARREIDAISLLPDLVSAPLDGNVTADSAFHVWRQTVLARARLTSSVELYNRTGDLVSRFALNLPEYTGSAQKPRPSVPCDWEVFGEGAPFGTEERTMLHAERNICVMDGNGAQPEIVGTIVLHVLAFDYRTLPFIASQSPYFEVLRPADDPLPPEGTPGSDVDVAIYGWSRRPIYSSDRSAWPISDELFEQIYSSREPFWTNIPRGGDEMWRVYITNDRPGIFVIGYPLLTVFDRLVHLAELTTLAGIACVLVLVGTGLFTRASRERPRIGRALLREIRASFYRKLFLAFVLASIVPALTLAIVIRAYFAELLWDDVQAAAARTAAVARRVIEGSDELLRGADGMAPVSDDVMIWISQVIDQDVNIFEGPRLTATSERDLFASGLLPTRTPDSVYRAIAIQRLLSFVDEDTIGTFTYMIAATPVRAAGRDGILTVPLTTRQREIEREIDELDRGVHLAALCFILLGAGIGLSLAERIADPVRRLTRATNRIAGGDFDARIAVRSADELKRLVDAFNSMAAELKAQRTQLERTHRLEAWAEMARQVAHEIKNPLTPIQLSAEHLRRVHADRGEPLGPVLDGCVNSILGQVRLLRQIAAEFSSFASSPIAKRVPVEVPALVEEVVAPYRTGLADRITIDNRVRDPLPKVSVDRTLIARALSNIVENALHAMPGQGTFTIAAEAGEDHVTIRARDTGVGMDEEALARVFEPYFSTKATGTGLGLTIARRNVEISGGAIDVESARGQGTTVIMRLPIA